MANSKRKCKLKSCGEYTTDFVIWRFGTFCSNEHAIDFAAKKSMDDKTKREAKREKDDNKKHAVKKREFYANDTKTRKAAAKQACHAYIRARDKGLPCICCGRPLGEKFDAGHFWESGNNSFIRYNEDNIHAQSVYCNQYKGGDSGYYRENLIKKIGLIRVEYLDQKRSTPIKRTAQDYREIEDYYKEKLAALPQG